MGVLRCDRNGCENILCGTYVSGAGYVCRDCQEEFKSVAPKRQTWEEIRERFNYFMSTEKDQYFESDVGDTVTAEEFFEFYEID